MPSAVGRRKTASMAARPTADELVAWLDARGGLAHRRAVLDAGFSSTALRRLAASGRTRVVRRSWVARPGAEADLVAAASAGGRVTCISLARRLGWWMPEGSDAGPHLHLRPGAASPGAGVRGRVHWTRPLIPEPSGILTASREDALAHIAVCLPHDDALAVWESACRISSLAPETLRRLPWTTRAAHELAAEVTGLSDSGLETLLFAPLRRAGVRVIQQAHLAGRFVDGLIGDLLVVQTDGYAHHASSAQRSADIAHDVELRLRGYTVLRFSYRQVVRERALVERTIGRAMAQRLHIAG